jgi:biopolymer transport protein ExbD
VKTSRRIERMSRNRVKLLKLNLTSLIDVFTILVFFLLFQSGASEIIQTPKEIKLPESVAEAKPRETVVVFVGRDEVLVQGDPVMRVTDIDESSGESLEPITRRLAELSANVIGLRTQAVAQSQEVTVLADKSIPFSIVKRVMSSCAAQGYGRISLAVTQKASSTPQT